VETNQLELGLKVFTNKLLQKIFSFILSVTSD